MSSRLKKLLSLVLVFVLVFQMMPASAFADGLRAEGSAPTLAERPSTLDSIYYQGVSEEYTADDVLWEIDEKRTETEKHFHMANGSDIAVSYAFPVHYMDDEGEYQEIDNSLKLYNADGTLSTAPVESGLLQDVELGNEPLDSGDAEPVATPVPAATPIPEATITPSPAEADSVVSEEANSEELTVEDAEEPLVDATGENAEALSADANEGTAEAFSADVNGETAVRLIAENEAESETQQAETTAEEMESGTVADEEAAETAANESAAVAEPNGDEEEETAAVVTETADAEAILEELPIDTRVYKNTAGLADVQLAVSGGSRQLASISYGDFTVTLTPRIGGGTASMSRAAAMNEALETARVAGRVKQAAALADEDSFEAKIIPQNLTSAVVYDGLLNGADLEYVVGETSLKENIIVNEPAASYAYDFLLDTGGLSPNLTDAGNIELKDNTGKAIFTIPAGYMVDANGVGSMEVAYALQAVSGSKYILTVTADKDWLNAEGRAFPVTIDPPVYLQGFYNIETGTIFQYYPDAIGGQRATEALGYYSANGGYCRTLVRVNNLPELPDNSYVVNSAIYLYEVAYDHVGMSTMLRPRRWNVTILQRATGACITHGMILLTPCLK